MVANDESRIGMPAGIGEPHAKIMWLGVGGIGMSALAQFFHLRGIPCLGYDRTPSALTRKLENLGIEIQYDFDCPLPDDVTAVVYTPAVGENDPRLLAARRRGLPVHKRSAVLGRLSESFRCIAVAGAHGKTTTCAIVAHMLQCAGLNPVAFVGGVMKNYDSNLLAGTGDRMVVEADEFDKSFLTLHPYLAAVTSFDSDHLDVYRTPENVVAHYVKFVGRVRPGGTVVLPVEARAIPLPAAVTPLYFSTDENVPAHITVANYRVENRRSIFDYRYGNVELRGLEMGILGRYNAVNAAIGITLALLAGAKMQFVAPAIASFRGLRRRFEIVYESQTLALIDDYAHHPTEIRSFLEGVRRTFGGYRVVVVFQPHLYSRTRDFAAEFGAALSLADRVVLLPIYPAREEPLAGVSSSLIAPALAVPHVLAENFETAVERALDFCAGKTALCTVGAGDVDRMPEMFLERLR
jgi:UDP-N-acetylmuramate--alanine ligase